MVSSLQSNLEGLDHLVEDFRKSLALDGLCSELDLKFSKLKLDESQSDRADDQQTKADLMRDISMDSVQQDLQKQIEESYNTTFDQIKSILRQKQRYFDQLKL